MVKVDRLPLHETRVNGDEVEHLSISINAASEGQHEAQSAMEAFLPDGHCPGPGHLLLLCKAGLPITSRR